MGMFDWVNVEMLCPLCKKGIVKRFQSKSNDCQLDTLDPQYVVNFYSECPKCKEWIEFSRDWEIPSRAPRETPYTKKEVEALGFSLQKKPEPW